MQKVKSKLFTIFILTLLFLSMFAILAPHFDFVIEVGATTIFSSGFESGGFISDGWTGTSGTPTVVSDPVHHGSYAMKTTAVNKYAYKTVDVAEVYTRVYFRTATLPNASNQEIAMISGWAGATSMFQASVIYSSGLRWRINYRNGATWASALGAVETILADTWYCVEIYWLKDASAGIVRLYVDDVQKVQATGLDTDNYGNVTQMRVGYVGAGIPITANSFIDCVVVADTYIGEESEASGIYFSSFGTTANIAGAACTFFVNCTALGGSLSHYIFQTNNTGSIINDTATAFTSTWVNVTKILNSTAYVRVEWKVYANTTEGDRSETGVQSLITETSNVVWAESGSAADIQSAVNEVGSMGGGTVKVPEGTYNWYNDQVSVSYDNVTIMGQGIDVTIINQTKNAPFNIMFSFSNCKNPRITGFTLKGLMVGSDAGPPSSVGVGFYDCEDFRADYCKFIDFAETAIKIRSTGTSSPCYGVVDHCTIMNPYKSTYGGSWAYGIYIRSNAYSPSAWDNDITHFLGQYPGNQTHPLVIIEDCVTYQTRHAVTSNQLGWFVIRHNTFYQNNSNSIIDIHGGLITGVGGRGLECYDNVIDHQGTGGWGVGTRGGDGVIFNNTIKNTQTGIELTLDSADDPKPTHQMWIWNNTFQNVNTNFKANPTYFTENEDYFLRAPNQEQDGFTYTPYTYPHPLTTGFYPPLYNNVGFNTTIAGAECKFSVRLYDYDGEVSGYYFEHNITGVYQNETWATIGAPEGWANITKTLNSTVGVKIRFRWLFNDTDNLWGSTGYWSLTTTSAGIDSVELIAHDDEVIQTSNLATFSYLVSFVSAIENASLWLNISDTWQNVKWNTTTVTNNTNAITFNFGPYPSATYIWNIRVWNSTNGVFATTNRTINVTIDPVFQGMEYNDTTRGKLCLFTAIFSDTNGLHGAKFSHNKTGSWANETFTLFSGGYVNCTLTLPSDYGIVLQFCWYGNDTDGHWTTSPIFNLTTTYIEIIITINSPQNTTYSSGTISVNISISTDGTLDTRWWNVKNGSEWVCPSNQTYTSPTQMTGMVNGTYTFYVWANITEGESEEETVVFTVAIPESGIPPVFETTVILTTTTAGVLIIAWWYRRTKKNREEETP